MSVPGKRQAGDSIDCTAPSSPTGSLAVESLGSPATKGKQADAAQFLGAADAKERDRLIKAGISELSDLAFLEEDEIQRVTGQPCSPALLLLKAEGLAQVEAAADAPLLGPIRHLFPTTDPTPPKSGQTYRPGTSRVSKMPKLEGARDPQWLPSPPHPPRGEEDVARRMKAAMAVVKILRENLPHSAFLEEVESHGGA